MSDKNSWPQGMRPSQAEQAAPPTSGKRMATAKQLEFARELGLNVPVDMSATEISVLIDAALDDQRADTTAALLSNGSIEPWLRVLRDSTPEDMVKEMQRRGKCAILVSWDQDDNKSCTLSSGDLTNEETHDQLFLIGWEIIKRRNPELAGMLDSER